VCFTALPGTISRLHTPLHNNHIITLNRLGNGTQSAGKRTVNIWTWDNQLEKATLEHFRFYTPHLAVLQAQMSDWKPRTFRDLFVPGYKDRFTWFTAFFGLGIGIIGILSLVASIIQIAIAVVALKASNQ
jgi:hypothetical protein